MTEIRYPEHGSPSRVPEYEWYEWQGHRGEVLDTIEWNMSAREAGVSPESPWRRRETFRVIRCQSCILTHVVPLPSEAWLEAYYTNHFYQTSKTGMIRQYEEDRSWWEMWHGITLEQAEALAPITKEFPYIGHVLDVGTGPGIFLDVAKKRCWITIGLDPSPVLYDELWDRGHNIFSETLEAYVRSDKSVPRSLDLIHAYEVLEHVPQPDVFLEQCWNLLKPAGVIAITVPNDYSTLQMAACEQLGLPHWWVSPPEHLNHFSAKTLQLLLRRSGFTIRDLRGTFPLEQFILQGRNYVGNDELGRQCHRERVAYEMAIYKAGGFDWLLDQYRRNVEHSYSYAVGREVVCIAQKEV